MALKLSDDQKGVIFVFGYICSGKTTICNKIEDSYDQEVQRIKVSSIVKDITKFDSRSKLHTTKSFDTQIAEHIKFYIDNSTEQIVIVDGIRQFSIFEEVYNHINNDYHEMELKWLHAEYDELERRYKERSSDEDDESFAEAFHKDNKLGITDLLFELIKHYNVEFINTN